MNSKERLFIAIALPEHVQVKAAEWLRSLRGGLSFQKWVHPDDLHITLKFLGETEQAKKAEVLTALQHIGADVSPFTLQLGKLGVFGREQSPSVLWSGIGGETKRLSSLQAKVELAMEQAGFPRENRVYKPHLTLARRYAGQPGWRQELLKPFELPEAVQEAWTADKIVLYRSHLDRLPMYEPVQITNMEAQEK